ncbi:MAG: ClC family H(+)/Cl(-) exchange transporter [Eubacterium sp.]|nr:ClC family H(+)/Cl(-) exchange transporter [Eubacterium sp.]
MREKERGTLRKLEAKRKESIYLIIRGIEVGIVAGLVSVLYRWLLSNAESGLEAVIQFVKGSPVKTALWFLALAALGVLVSLIVKWEPMSGGSGIPQIAGEIRGYLSPKWWRVIVAKLIGGTAAVFGGLSLGREGPSIQLGGMAAKGVAEITKADKTTKLRMISCGGGAGLAAAFNAPLAGIMFVLEELQHTFDKSILCMGIVACVTADFVSKIFFGQSTIFSYETANVPLRYYWLLVILGLLLGVLGAGYNIVMIFGQDLFKKLKKIPLWIKLCTVFLISGIISFYIPQILGGGHSMVEFLLEEHPTIPVMLFLLLAKFIFSTVSFGSGAPGGIFFPLLILGTYVGAIFGDASISLLGLKADIWEEFVVISMAGLFASIVRSPITGIILVFEMTGNINNLLPLVVVSLISYAAANLIGVTPIYTSLLERILNGLGNDATVPAKAEKVLKTYVIPTGSPVNGKMISEIDWGKHCVIVSVDRDENPITPKGDTLLKSGDELVLLVSQRHFADDCGKLEKMING